MTWWIPVVGCASPCERLEFDFDEVGTAVLIRGGSANTDCWYDSFRSAAPQCRWAVCGDPVRPGGPTA